MAGITIGVASDAREFASGTKSGVLEPLQSVAETLDKVSTAGDKAGDQLESSMKDAQQATTKQEKSLQDAISTYHDLATASQRTAHQQQSDDQAATDEFEVSGREKKKIIKETYQTIAESGKQAASQAVSSFTGNVDDITGTIQGILAGLAASNAEFGIIFAGLAAGIGLVQGLIGNADENTKEFKADVSELTKELIAAGSTGSVSLDDIISKLRDMATTEDGAGTNLKDLKDAADRSHTSFRTLADLYDGNVKGLDAAVEAGKKKLYQDQLQDEVLSKLSVEQQKASTGDKTAYADSLRKAEGQKKVNEYLQQAADTAHEAAEQEKLYIAGGGLELQKKAQLLKDAASAQDDATKAAQDAVSPSDALTSATKEATDAEQKRAQAVADGTKSSKDSWQDYAKSVTASADQILSAYEDQIKAQENWNTNSQTVLTKYGVGVEKFFSDLGPDGQAALQNALDTWSQQDWDRLKTDTAAATKAAGVAGAEAYTDALNGGLPKTVPGPTVDLQLPDIKGMLIKAQSQINAFGPLKSGYVTADAYGRIVK